MHHTREECGPCWRDVQRDGVGDQRWEEEVLCVRVARRRCDLSPPTGDGLCADGRSRVVYGVIVTILPRFRLDRVVLVVAVRMGCEDVCRPISLEVHVRTVAASMTVPEGRPTRYRRPQGEDDRHEDGSGKGSQALHGRPPTTACSRGHAVATAISSLSKRYGPTASG